MSCWANGIDWVATGSLWTGIGTLALATATFGLAWFASKGLSAWKEQHFGIKKLDLAQELLGEVFLTEEILNYVIGPFVSSAELERVPKRDEESVEDYELRRTYDAVLIRYDEHSEHFSRVRVLLFKARVVLGEDIYDAVRRLLMLRSKIQMAAHLAYSKSVAVARYERQIQFGLPVDGDLYQRAVQQLTDAQDRFWSMSEDGTLKSEVERASADSAQLLRECLDKLLTKS